RPGTGAAPQADEQGRQQGPEQGQENDQAKGHGGRGWVRLNRYFLKGLLLRVGRRETNYTGKLSRATGSGGSLMPGLAVAPGRGPGRAPVLRSGARGAAWLRAVPPV